MRRARRRRVADWVVGLSVVALVTVAVYAAFGGSFPWQKDYELKAIVSSGLELQSRSPVRIAGVEVGKVKKVERGPGNTAIVTMSIEEVGQPIHADATIKVRPRIFLEGNFFVDLRPGTPQAPTVASGHTLPISQTDVAVQFDEILSGLKTDTRKSLVQFVDQLTVALNGGGGRALRLAMRESSPAFRNLAIAAEAARGTMPHDLSELIAGSATTTAALASRDRQLVTLIDGLDRTTAALASRRTQLEASLPALDRLSAEAPAALRAVDEALPEARALALDVRPALRAAPESLRLAMPVLREARALVGPDELPALLRQLDPAIDQLQPLEPRLQELLGLVEPVTDCARTHVLPVLRTPLVDPPHTTGDPPYREMLHGAVGLASASQNFDGNGPAVRYHAGFGDQLVSFGPTPTVGEALVATTSEPLLGTRPKKPAQQPPFRYDLPCRSQRLPDLRAETGPAPAQRKVALKAGRR